jgi:hypothetical protein
MRRLSSPTVTKLSTLELAHAAPEEGSLAELQLWMTRLLRHGKNLANDPEMAEAALRHFCGNDRVSPAEQIEIYREQFWLRHIGSLIEDFPGICGVLGQDDWQKLAESYLSSFVPVGFSLRDLGAGLPAHVLSADFLPHQTLVYDMARLEWAYIEAFDAPDTPTLDADHLATLDDSAWENARITLADSLRLLELDYPVADLRRALRTAENSETPVAIPEAKRTHLVVYRRELRLWDKEVEPEAFALLTALASDVPLVQAVNQVLSQFPEAEARIADQVGDWFLRWGKLGWIGNVRS